MIERDRREQAGIEVGNAGSRQRLSDGGGFPAHEIAGNQQRDTEQDAERNAHAGTEQALVDRVFDEERARQRDAGSPQPDEAARAQPLLEAARRRLAERTRWGQRRLRFRLWRRGLQDRLWRNRRLGQYRLRHRNGRHRRLRRLFYRMRGAMWHVDRRLLAVAQATELKSQEGKFALQAPGRAKRGDAERGHDQHEENPAGDQDQSPHGFEEFHCSAPHDMRATRRHPGGSPAASWRGRQDPCNHCLQ